MGAVKFRAVGIAVATALFGWASAAGAAVPSGGCTQAMGQTTCTFAFTGAAESFKVPVGVTSATFDLHGAQAGQANYFGAPRRRRARTCSGARADAR